MLRLRPYKKCDAQKIVTWCKDELTFRRWSFDRFGDFPLTKEELNRKYFDLNGDCKEPDNFYPFTAYDDDGIVGSLILRYTDDKKQVLRIGFVIVDDEKRGKGYGKEMLLLSLKYAFELLCAQKVTIGVFENNAPAYNCYKAAGFKDVKTDEDIICEVLGERWKMAELCMTKEDYELSYGEKFEKS